MAFNTGIICSPRVTVLINDGFRASPLKRMRGFRSDNWRIAVTNRAAPPTGSWVPGSMLYTSLKWTIVMVDMASYCPPTFAQSAHEVQHNELLLWNDHMTQQNRWYRTGSPWVFYITGLASESASRGYNVDWLNAWLIGLWNVNTRKVNMCHSAREENWLR